MIARKCACGCGISFEGPPNKKYLDREHQLRGRKEPEKRSGPRLGAIRHFVIPDTQVKPGVPTAHLPWIGQYIVDKRPDRLIHLGDHADMASLSSYDRKGGKLSEGRRYVADIDAANEGMDELMSPLEWHNHDNPRDKILPDRDFFLGNHEYRIVRAINNDAAMEGLVSLDDLNYAAWGWNVHDFLVPKNIDGVWYSHYFANPKTGKPYGGESIDARLKTLGHSFAMGHQQGLMWGRREKPTGAAHVGLVAGSCYLHDEEYMGPQGNNHWRGVVVMTQVEDGQYDPNFVSLDSLCRRYEGMTLADYTRKYL